MYNIPPRRTSLTYLLQFFVVYLSQCVIEFVE